MVVVDVVHLVLLAVDFDQQRGIVVAAGEVEARVPAVGGHARGSERVGEVVAAVSAGGELRRTVKKLAAV